MSFEGGIVLYNIVNYVHEWITEHSGAAFGDSGVKASVDEKGELYIESLIVCMGYALYYRDLGKVDVNKSVIDTGDVAYINERDISF